MPTAPTLIVSTARQRLARANLVLICCTVLAACGGGGGSGDPQPAPVGGQPPAPAPAPIPQLKAGTWAVLGSSTAAGAGAPSGKGWVALVQSAYANRGAQVVNLSLGGTSTYAGVSTGSAPVAGRPAPDPEHNIDKALVQKPVVLFVSYPTNDTALGYSADETVANLLAIRTRAMAEKVPVILLSTQPRNLTSAQLAQLRAIDGRLAAAAGPCFVEVNQGLAAPDGRLSPNYDSGDGVHPNGAGHQFIADRVKTLIDSQQCVITSAP